MSSPIIDILEEVALGLGELKQEVVFVGGAIASLYIVDEGVQRIRPSEDEGQKYLFLLYLIL